MKCYCYETNFGFLEPIPSESTLLCMRLDYESNDDDSSTMQRVRERENYLFEIRLMLLEIASNGSEEQMLTG